MADTNPQFLDHVDACSDYASARVIVLSGPLESTISYGGGTALGPRAILAASAQVELFDMDLGRCPHEIGVHSLPPIPCDNGPESAVEAIRRAVKQVVTDGKIPFLFGGEHTVTWGCLQGAVAALEHTFSVLQFDAHSDLRNDYEGSIYSHASVMRRAIELGLPVTGVGIRSMSPEEAADMISIGSMVRHFPASVTAGRLRDDKALARTIVNSLGEEVWLTFDIDAFDSSIIRETGTPEPGGLGWYDVMSLFAALAESDKKIIGMDLVELAPASDSHVDSFTCARLAHKMIGFLCPGQGFKSCCQVRTCRDPGYPRSPWA